MAKGKILRVTETLNVENTTNDGEVETVAWAKVVDPVVGWCELNGISKMRDPTEKEKIYLKSHIKDLVEEADRDKSDLIDKQEWRFFLRKFWKQVQAKRKDQPKKTLSQDAMDSLFGVVDFDGDGEISLIELQMAVENWIHWDEIEQGKESSIPTSPVSKGHRRTSTRGGQLEVELAHQGRIRDAVERLLVKQLEAAEALAKAKAQLMMC